MFNICLIGLGRTGKEIAKVLLKQEDFKVVMAVGSENSDKIGKDLGEIAGCPPTGVIVSSSKHLEENIIRYKPNVAVEFSSPESTLNNLEVLAKMKVRTVVGTTGFNKLQYRRLLSIAGTHKTGIVYAPNITVGVNVLMVLTNLAVSILENYDCTIVESHFKQKKDSPSGTAKKIAREVVKGKAREIPDVFNQTDHDEIPIHSVRAGGIVGRHKVILASDYDTIEILHESFTRTAFALGAVKAIRFICDRTGYFEMDDVLDLKQVILSYIERETQIKRVQML